MTHIYATFNKNVILHGYHNVLQITHIHKHLFQRHCNDIDSNNQIINHFTAFFSLIIKWHIYMPKLRITRNAMKNPAHTDCIIGGFYECHSCLNL